MAIKKYTNRDGSNSYKITFGAFYVGDFVRILKIIDDWYSLIIHKEQKDYKEKLKDFNELVLNSRNPYQKELLKSTKIDTYEIINLIWFFGYRENRISKPDIPKEITSVNPDSIQILLNICRPHRRNVPELDKLQQENHLFEETSLGLKLNSFEKKGYRKSLKRYNEFTDFQNEFRVAIDLMIEQNRIPNLNDLKDLRILKSELEEIKNTINQNKSQIEQLFKILSGEKQAWETD